MTDAPRVPPACEPFLEPYIRHYGTREYTIEPTPRDAVDRYFWTNRDRAIRLVLMMCHWSGPPFGWQWGDPNYRGWGKRAKFKLRKPPMPYDGGSPYWNSGCPLCGCEVHALGWHEPWTDRPSKASWHAACAYVYRFMTKPADFIVTEPDHEADHIVPLWRAHMDFAHEPWPICLRWWLPGNLQSIHRDQHVEKTRRENREMRARRLAISKGVL